MVFGRWVGSRYSLFIYPWVGENMVCMYVFIYLFKMGKMSTFWNIKKVFTQWDNAEEKAKEVFLKLFHLCQ